MRNAIRKSLISAAIAGVFLASCGGERPETLIDSAKDYLAKNDSKSALIQVKNALQANPDLAEARFLLGKTLLSMGDMVGAEVELQKARALNYPMDQVVPLQARVFIAQGKFKKVIEELAKSELSATEARADLLTSVAVAQAATGKTEDAQKSIATVLSIQGEYPPALIVQARLQAGAGDLEGAIKLFDKVLGSSPSNHDAWKFKGDAYAAQSDYVKAAEAYRKAIEVRPDFVVAHAALVGNLIEQAKLDEASQAFDAMKRVAPKHPRTLYLSSQMAYQRKDYKSARVGVQELLSISPNSPSALQLAGAIELKLGSFLQAESYLTKALQVAPESSTARRLLVTLYLGAGQAVKATSALQPLLENSDKDANVLALAGEVFLLSGDVERASAYFSRASKLNPKDVSKRTAFALTQLMKGETAQAFQELEAIAAEDSGTTADMALISAHLRRKEFDKALKAVDVLEKKQVSSPAPHHIRGNIFRAKQDIPDARKSFERALEVSPAYFAAAASLAALDMTDQRPEEAKKRFESILKADPKSVQALLALAELKSRQGGGVDEVAGLIQRAVAANPSEAGPRVALVSWWLKNKDAKKATTVAQEAVAAISDQPELLGVLGLAQQAAGDPNQALATYAKMASLQPNSPIPHMRSAEIHNQAKNKDSAAQSLRKALAVKSDFADALRGLVGLNLEAGNIGEALAVAREAQKKHPKDAIGYLLEGDVNAFKKSWADAAVAYRQGLNQVPNTELAIKLHAALLASKPREADAFEASWLKGRPSDIAFLMYLGEVANGKGNFAAAVRTYRVVVGIQPNNALALNNLAWAAGQQKDPKALEYAERAFQLMPNQAPIMDTLAVLLSEKGESTRAVELMKKALTLSPDASDIRLNYARVLIKAGNKQDARKEIEALEKLGTKFRGQSEVVRLKALI